MSITSAMEKLPKASTSLKLKNMFMIEIKVPPVLKNIFDSVNNRGRIFLVFVWSVKQTSNGIKAFKLLSAMAQITKVRFLWSEFQSLGHNSRYS